MCERAFHGGAMTIMLEMRVATQMSMVMHVLALTYRLAAEDIMAGVRNEQLSPTELKARCLMRGGLSHCSGVGVGVPEFESRWHGVPEFRCSGVPDRFARELRRRPP